jgi:superfamily II DNA or RNA helicase
MTVTFDIDTVARKPRIISDHLTQIRELFSVEDKAQLFLRRRIGRNIPVRKYAITNKGFFDIPFFEEICKHIRIKFPSLRIQETESFKKFKNIETISTSLEKLKFDLRDYQQESAETAINKGHGIIVLPTSAGKTLVIASIAATAVREKHAVLVLVPDIQLVSQSYGDFLEYGIPESQVSKWTGSFEYQNTNIVIANNQILLSEKQDLSVLKNFSVVIVDEVHKMASAEKISKLIKNLKCKHIFGFTGSLPENQFDIWSINRIFGSIIYFKKSIELRQEQYITKVRVVALELNYKNIPEFTKPSMSNPTAGYEEETTWLHTQEYRNSVLCKLLTKLDTNTLVLVDRIVHGEHLLEYFKQHLDKEVFFVQGSVEIEERERIKQIMESTQGVVCIAISKIFSTGISIKNLHNVVFASIGKARIKIIQSIGRSLRLHHTKEIATIFDIADTCLIYGFKHFEERKRLYEAEKIPITTATLVET